MSDYNDLLNSLKAAAGSAANMLKLRCLFRPLP